MFGLGYFKFIKFNFTGLMGGVLALWPSLVLGSEVDPFTDRHLVHVDVTDRLNAYVQRHLEASVREVNQFTNCNRARLFDQIDSRFNGFMVTEAEVAVAGNPEIASVETSFERSIFSGFSWREGLGMHLIPSMTISPLLSLAGQVVGVDKLGHFFSQGYMIYQIADTEARGVIAALREMRAGEDGAYGLGGNGVRSFGDLAANYRGYQFWKSLAEGEVDGAGTLSASPIPSLIQCQSGQWSVVGRFDWRQYVDIGWDEAYNCFDLRTDSMRRAVDQQLGRLSRQWRRSIRCPLSADVCAPMRRLYEPYASYLIHPSCLGNEEAR